MTLFLKIINATVALALVFVILLANYDGFPSGGIRFLFNINICLSMLGLSLSMNNARRGLLDLAYWLFTVGLLVLPGMLHVAWSTFRWPVVHSDRDIVYALVVLLIANLVYFVCSWYELPLGKYVERTSRFIPTFSRKSLLVIFALLVPGVMIVAVFGPQVFFSGRSNVTISFSGASGYYGRLLMLSRSLATIAFLYCFLMVRNHRVLQLRLAPLHLAFSLTSLVVAAILINPLSSPRFWTLSLLLAICVLTTRRFDVKFKSFWTPMAVVGFITFMSLIKSLGVSDVALSERSLQLNNPFDSGHLRDYVLTADFDNFQTMMNPIIFTQEEGIRWGKNLLGVVLFWVPNDIWRGKPEDTGMMAADAFGYKFNNLSVPIVAEFYAAFGLFGVVLGMVGLAFMVRFLDGQSIKSVKVRSHLTFFDLFYAIFVGFFFINLRGSMLGGMPQYGFALAIPMFVCFTPSVARFLTSRSTKLH